MSGDSKEDDNQFLDKFSAFCEWNNEHLKEHIGTCNVCLYHFMRHFYKADVRGNSDKTCEYSDLIIEDINRVLNRIQEAKDKGEKYFKGDLQCPDTKQLSSVKSTVFQKLKSESKEVCQKRVSYLSGILNDLHSLEGLFDTSCNLKCDPDSLGLESKRYNKRSIRRQHAKGCISLGTRLKDLENKYKSVDELSSDQEENINVDGKQLQTLELKQTLTKALPSSLLKNPGLSNKEAGLKKVCFSPTVDQLEINGQPTQAELMLDYEAWKKDFLQRPARLKPNKNSNTATGTN